MAQPLDHHDVILAGGGLSCGILAYRLAQTWPHLKILILEKNERLGGQHTWSFHQGDLTLDQHRWVAPFVSKGWSGYCVEFPKVKRKLSTGYYSIRSEHFHEVVTSVPQIEVRTQTSVKSMSSDQVILADGSRLNATLVIDGRGFFDQTTHEPMGYQKFVGLDVTLSHPHGLENPVIMDATCDQTDGYRFFYLLPWNDHQLLIEDTYYSNSPTLSAGFEREKSEILKYIQKKNWVVQTIDRQEVGVLPIPMISHSPELEVPTIGVRANLFHATTGYSFAEAVRLADEIATNPVFLESKTLYEALGGYIASHLRKGNFFRFLNRMLFFGAENTERRRIFERFYTLSEKRISRFYAGELRFTDYIRILVGKPPISISKALKCVFEPNLQGEGVDSRLGISNRTEA